MDKKRVASSRRGDHVRDSGPHPVYFIAHVQWVLLLTSPPLFAVAYATKSAWGCSEDKYRDMTSTVDIPEDKPGCSTTHDNVRALDSSLKHQVIKG